MGHRVHRTASAWYRSVRTAPTVSDPPAPHRGGATARPLASPIRLQHTLAATGRLPSDPIARAPPCALRRPTDRDCQLIGSAMGSVIVVCQLVSMGMRVWRRRGRQVACRECSHCRLPGPGSGPDPAPCPDPGPGTRSGARTQARNAQQTVPGPGTGHFRASGTQHLSRACFRGPEGGPDPGPGHWWYQFLCIVSDCMSVTTSMWPLFFWYSHQILIIHITSCLRL